MLQINIKLQNKYRYLYSYIWRGFNMKIKCDETVQRCLN